MRRHEPTPEQRRTVKTMAGFGIPQPEVADFLGVDMKTLSKHFREELDRGTTEANAKVAQSLIQMVTQGKNVAAEILRLKASAGRREKIEIRPVMENLDHISDAELEVISRPGQTTAPAGGEDWARPQLTDHAPGG